MNKLKQLQTFLLLFISGNTEFSILVTFHFGIISRLAIVTHIGNIVFIRKIEAKLLKSLGFRDSDNINNESPYNNSNSGSNRRGKLAYLCLVAGAIFIVEGVVNADHS